MQYIFSDSHGALFFQLITTPTRIFHQENSLHGSLCIQQQKKEEWDKDRMLLQTDLETLLIWVRKALQKRSAVIRWN